MNQLSPRMLREHRTVQAMVELHCRHEHGRGEVPCAECRDLLAFAAYRLARCPHGDAKPNCAKCPIHCYKPDRREQMRRVMRVAGPRMLGRHPILTLRHWLDGFRKAPPPRHPARRSAGEA